MNQRLRERTIGSASSSLIPVLPAGGKSTTSIASVKNGKTGFLVLFASESFQNYVDFKVWTKKKLFWPRSLKDKVMSLHAKASPMIATFIGSLIANGTRSFAAVVVAIVRARNLKEGGFQATLLKAPCFLHVIATAHPTPLPMQASWRDKIAP